MARSFNGTSSDFLRYSAAVVSAAPLTLAAWIKRGTVGNVGQVVGIYNSGSSGNVNINMMQLSCTDNGDATLSAASAGSSAGYASSTVTKTVSEWPEDTWLHGAAVFESDSSRYAYAGGTAGAQETTTKAVTGQNRTTIGRRDSASATSHFNGGVAEVGIWNVALSASDVAILAAGVCPLLVRPEALLAYWPLWGIYSPETDLVGGFGMTVTGTSVIDQPATIQPVGRAKLVLPGAAVAANPFPAWLGMRQQFEEEFEYLSY